MKKTFAIFTLIFLFGGCKQECDNSLFITNSDPYFYYAFLVPINKNYSTQFGYEMIELGPNSNTRIDLGGDNSAEGFQNIVITLFTDTIFKETWYRTCKPQTKKIDRF